ncbi:Acyl-CoA thioesterase 2 [Clavibacter michiganensis subsp. michiganensis]|nr:Acyl-CoA thioesterase 2 [Clavibacter michiganensis subsp. michiganensis]
MTDHASDIPDDGPLAGLLTALDLTDTGARTSEDISTGPSQWMPMGRVFGGQVLAQSLVAAMRTTEADRRPHSMHGYFLRPGDVTKPITFSVDRIHDGRSFSTRRTQAYQDGRPILSMIASFQDTDEGLEHQAPMPEGIPEPESLPSARDVLSRIDHPVAAHWANDRPFDMRHVEQPVYFGAAPDRVAHQAVWIRAIGRLPDDPAVHLASLAYASDYSILESIYRRHGLSWATPASRPRASTTRCGSTGSAAPTSGCSTCRSRRAPRAAAACRSAGSTRATACCSRAWPRRAWSGSRPSRGTDARGRNRLSRVG